MESHGVYRFRSSGLGITGCVWRCVRFGWVGALVNWELTMAASLTGSNDMARPHRRSSICGHCRIPKNKILTLRPGGDDPPAMISAAAKWIARAIAGAGHQATKARLPRVHRNTEVRMCWQTNTQTKSPRYWRVVIPERSQSPYCYLAPELEAPLPERSRTGSVSCGYPWGYALYRRTFPRVVSFYTLLY